MEIIMLLSFILHLLQPIKSNQLLERDVFGLKKLRHRDRLRLLACLQNLLSRQG